MQKLVAHYPWLVEVRGRGLMLGLVLDHPAKEFEKALLAKGLIVIATADTVIRMLPPLNITEADVREAARIFTETAAAYQPPAGA